MTAEAAGPPAGVHLALTIGVSTFTDPDRYPPLRYAATLAEGLRQELNALGYATAPPVPAEYSSELLGTTIHDSIKAAQSSDVLLVHVLSHGEVSDGTSKLYAIGSDGSRHDLAGVEGWLTAVQDGPHPPLVLFLLDLCQSGTAARLPWQGAGADGSARAWVIAACGPQEQALNGWLTKATTTVLRRLRGGELDVDPGLQYVPLQLIGRQIRIEVARLAATEGGGLPQQVTGTQLDFTADEPDLPFFKNPAHSADPLVVMRGHEEPAIAEFADGIGEPAAWGTSPPPEQERPGQGQPEQGQPGQVALSAPAAWASGIANLPDDVDLSARFWADRTRGHGLITAAPDAGCFSGRTAELSELVPWLQGYGSQRSPDGRPHTLTVVTGGPGVGKSALLGILVCAAHPRLRAATSSLWNQATGQVPGQIDSLVAVHARQRDLADVTGCLARQLAPLLTRDSASGKAGGQGGAATGLSAVAADVAPPAAITGPAALVAAVAGATAPQPVPVIVLDALDEALASQRIVDELILPLAAARRADGAPACRVLVGSRPYGFDTLLEAARAQGGLIDLDKADRKTLAIDLGGYMTKLLQTQPGYRDDLTVCSAFGFAVARSLTSQPDDRRWGEFLVAGLYTHSVLRDTAADPMTDLAEAHGRGARCPRTIPEVLHLDLAARPNHRDLLEILQIVALARGAGMPASVIDRCRERRPRFAEWTPTLRALAELGFYLRRANDEDGTTLYRVFHEGLADHLRPPAAGPDDQSEILLRAAQSAWEPAWSRRTAEQALLTGMLAPLGQPGARRWDLAEPYVLRHALDHARSADNDLGPLVFDAEFLVYAPPVVLASLRSLNSETWNVIGPLLAEVDLAEVDEISVRPDMVGAGSAPRARRRAALAVAAARQHAYDLAATFAEPPAGSPEPPLTWRPRWTAGPLFALLRSVHDSRGLSSNAPSALAVGAVNGEASVAVGFASGQVRMYYLANGELINEFWPSDSAIRALGVSDGTGIVSVDAEGVLHVSEAVSGTEIGPLCTLPNADVTAVHTARLGNRVIGAAVGTDRVTTFVDLMSGRVIGHIIDPDFGIDVSAGGDTYHVAKGVSGSIYVKVGDETVGTLAGHHGRVNLLTPTVIDGRPIAISAGSDRTIRLWDLLDLREADYLEVPGDPLAVIPAGEDHLAVLCGREVIVYQRRNPARPTPPPVTTPTEGEA